MVFASFFNALYQFGMADLKTRRENLGLTQAQLAELTGTSQPQIRRLENGERELTVAWAERLAGPLRTTAISILFPDAVIGGDPEARLRSALLAFGVDREDLGRAVSAVKVFVDDPDGQSSQDLPDDQSGLSSPRREEEPSR